MGVIQDQLSKVLVADLSNYDKETNTFFIKQYKQIKLEVGKYYLIKLNNVLLDKDSEVMCNWNNSEVPPHNCLKIEVIKTVGKMIYIQGISFDEVTRTSLGELWDGWIPTDEIKVLEG